MNMIGAAILGALAGYVSRRWTTELLSFLPAVTLGFILGLSLAWTHDDTSHNLWPLEIFFSLAITLPVFAAFGWFGMRAGQQQRDTAPRHDRASSSLSRWIVPGTLTGAVFVWCMVGATKIELQIRSGDEGQFRTTALKIREAQIRFVQQHGVFTNNGSALNLDGVTWAPPARFPEWTTIAGGYTIRLQTVINCTAHTCLLIAHPPGGGRICVTVGGEVKPDRDETLREHITYGDNAADYRSCVAAAR